MLITPCGVFAEVKDPNYWYIFYPEMPNSGPFCIIFQEEGVYGIFPLPGIVSWWFWSKKNDYRHMGIRFIHNLKKKLRFWPPKSGQNTHFFVLWCCNIVYIAHNCYFWKDNAPTIQKMQTFLKSDLPERRYWNLTIFGTCPNLGLKTINCRLLRHLASTDKIFAVQKFFLNFALFFRQEIFIFG